MAKISAQQLGKIIGALPHPVAKVLGGSAIVAGKARDIATEKFGYDFMGLAVRLALFFAVAYLIQVWFLAKISFNQAVQKAQEDPLNFTFDLFKTFVPVVAGANYLYNLFVPPEPTDPDEPIAIPKANEFFSSEMLQAVFSDKGFHGFRYWDIIKVVATLLVIMEWRRFSAMTKATGGQVQPLTHGLFILIITGLGLATIPQLLTKARKTFSNPQTMV